MDEISFRCMYENCAGGLIHSGSIIDRENNTTLEYKYVTSIMNVPSSVRTIQGKKRPLSNDKELDYLFLASFTIPGILNFIQEITSRHVHTVYLPYVSPAQRLCLLKAYYKNGKPGINEIHFLTDPDEFMEKCGVINRHFLYENGEDLSKDYVSMNNDLIHLPEGVYFPIQNDKNMEIVRQLEGKTISLRKAGYIKQAGWLLYAGVYGKPLYDMKEELSHATIVLFSGPVYTNCKDYAMNARISSINSNDCCRNEGLNANVSGCVQCLYQSESISIGSKASAPVPHEVSGHFLLGTYNLNKDMGGMLNRYSGIREMIRFNALGSCGLRDHWNKYFASMFTGEYTKFWYVSIVNETDSDVFLDIAKTSPKNRFLMGTEHISYCIRGKISAKVTYKSL